MKNEKQKEIKYFSMFTGVGGFELGIERANDLRRIQQRFSEGERNGKNNKNKRGDGDSRKFSCTGFELGIERANNVGRTSEECSNDEGNKSSFNESNGRGRRSCSFSSVGFSEIDKYASELLKQKFPSVKNYGDATKIIPSKLPDFNLLVGGFPCQAFSIAGKRRGFEDTRGTLFYDIARILKVKRPEYILLENVKGLLSHDRGRTFGTIIATLSELGYVVQWMVLNSKFFEVPQNRERVFIIGSLRGEPIPEILPLGENDKNDNQESRRKSLIQTEVSGTVTTKFGDRYQDTFINVINNPRGQGFEMNKRIYGVDGLSPTLQSSETEVKISSTPQIKRIRKLTPTECERLQGFPDGWTEGFSDTQRYKMMGNAVTVNVIKAVIGEMFKWK